MLYDFGSNTWRREVVTLHSVMADDKTQHHVESPRKCKATSERLWRQLLKWCPISGQRSPDLKSWGLLVHGHVVYAIHVIDIWMTAWPAPVTFRFLVKRRRDKEGRPLDLSIVVLHGSLVMGSDRSEVGELSLRCQWQMEWPDLSLGHKCYRKLPVLRPFSMVLQPYGLFWTKT